MTERLPPVEKLPLALRKNVRDDWDNKKPEIEKELSDILTVPWTVEVNPNEVFAYAVDGYAKESLGSCIAAYSKGAIWQLKSYESTYGETGLKELNDICHAHVLTMDVDLTKRFTYGGVDVDERGALRMLFAPDNLGCNIDYCMERDTLLKALNDAPPPPAAEGAFSFAARTGIRQDYEPKIEAIRAKVSELLAWPEIRLNPNWEEVFAALQAESRVKKAELREDWQSYMGASAISYFDGLLGQIQYQKFEDDDLLQEGFRDVVSKGEIKFRIVEKLKEDSYGECEIEDGILYLQSTAKTWGTNTSYAAQKLVDKL
ncbi:hypothetical protein PG994_006218 [Apiospora phragmitis]|uniref:Uncharacterized protein n=1 Tax=Apiospora phragmitis TaxID=2905665 RepID=A0ABR1VEF5_9PEZI